MKSLLKICAAAILCLTFATVALPCGHIPITGRIECQPPWRAPKPTTIESGVILALLQILGGRG